MSLELLNRATLERLFADERELMQAYEKIEEKPSFLYQALKLAVL